ncbi:hypothetical protein JZ751_016188 [Albula glossodonta]|uniref:Uncharacterized protein n=1 Tax=Albula glossodonta TaxID=121402 RepID=A0A8T2MVA7_9TELE|nr:hypothetical protein JZ751_016188 [Albula glossodonta]
MSSRQPVSETQFRPAPRCSRGSSTLRQVKAAHYRVIIRKFLGTHIILRHGDLSPEGTAFRFRVSAPACPLPFAAWNSSCGTVRSVSCGGPLCGHLDSSYRKLALNSSEATNSSSHRVTAGWLSQEHMPKLPGHMIMQLRTQSPQRTYKNASPRSGFGSTATTFRVPLP